MKSSTYGEAFIADDRTFMATLREAAFLDPLEITDDDGFDAFQSRLDEAPVAAAEEMTDRLLVWQEDRLDVASEPEKRAAKRDYDKVIGAFVARKTDLISVVPSAGRAVNNFIEAGEITPRADFYDYAFAAASGPNATYTDDERERALIDIFVSSTEVAHQGLHSILKARDALQNESSAAAGYLEAASGHMNELRQHTASVYRAVGPAFVANEVTRYLGGLRHEGKVYEGPNPSHSGFVLLDRFTYGSFDSLLADNPSLAAQFDYRQSELPPHMSRVMYQAAEANDDESLAELTARHQPSLAGTAEAVAKALRKFKVMHKSYADKGLEAKGGTLTTEEPDVLSDAIAFARKREK